MIDAAADCKDRDAEGARAFGDADDRFPMQRLHIDAAFARNAVRRAAERCIESTHIAHHINATPQTRSGKLCESEAEPSRRTRAGKIAQIAAGRSGNRLGERTQPALGALGDRSGRALLRTINVRRAVRAE